MDEVSLAGKTNVTEVELGSTTDFTWEPSVFGLDTAGTDSMLAETPAESADVIRRILGNESGACRDVVVLNAAAALWLAGKANDPLKCAALADEAIANGAAKDLLAKLGELSKQS
jgi:anthranilate phosphoribosyltransferase